MQVGIGVTEGGQVQLGAAPQLLDSAGGPCQIVGIVRQLLGRTLAQFLLVALQRQNTAAPDGLVLEQIENTGPSSRRP